MRQRPNILFVMADQCRADALGATNGWTRTPNLDRLAQEGVLFENAFTNAPECVPARISLALGRYPHETGVWENVRYTLDPGESTWMRAVEAAGYRTSVFGKTHLHPHEGDLRDRAGLMHAYGFQVVDETAGPHASASTMSAMTDSWAEAGLLERFRADIEERARGKRHVVRPSPLGLEHYYDVYVGRRAVEHLSRLPPGEKWFCWVSFGGPHEPWDVPEPFASLYGERDVEPPLPRLAGHERVGGLLRRAFDSPHYGPALSAGDVSAMRANYAGNVTLIDQQIGAILETIRKRRELDETLVVFTSDHGEMNGDHGLLFKGNFLDAAIRIPLIVRPPLGTGAAAARRDRSLVELIDVGATIADYAGAVRPAASHAVSLRPAIEDAAPGPRDAAITEFLGHVALIDAEWKIELAPDETATLLFDRNRDPGEQTNLAHDERHRAVVERLRARVRAFRAGSASAVSAGSA